MDRLDELLIFTAIIDAGSLAGAARKLRRSPPAITRALAELEDRVGARLIERTTRRLAPTEAGRAFAEQARAILSDYDAALARVSNEPVRGRLRVTAPVQFGRRHVAPLVASFLDGFPEVQVEFILNDRNLDLIDENIDAAIRIGKLSDSGHVALRAGEVRRIVVATPAYLTAHGVPATPGDLAKHEIVFHLRGDGAIEWRFGSKGRTTVARLRPRLLADDVETIVSAVKAGRGLGRVLSYQVFDELGSGTLVRLLKAHEPAALPVHVVTSGGSHMASKTRAFVDHAIRALRANKVLMARAEQ